MANSTSNSGGDVYDIRRIRRLVELMNEHDLSEIDLRQDETRIRIRRGAEHITQVMGAPGVAAAPQTVAATAVEPADAPPPSPQDDKKYLYVVSPTVGTFYAAPEPGAPAFVKVGDMVSADTTVCVVEAMKVFNAIPAEVTGRIVQVLVENEQPVEYNQQLFKVEPV